MTSTFPAPGPFARARLAEAAAPMDKATISVRGLWKIFGPAEHKVIGTPLAEMNRDELRIAAGSTSPSATSRSRSARARCSWSWACPAAASPRWSAA